MFLWNPATATWLNLPDQQVMSMQGQQPPNTLMNGQAAQQTYSAQPQQQPQTPYLNEQSADNYIPKQQIKRVNGKAGIEKLRMAANSSVIVPDANLPKVWMLVSDDFGNINSTPYRITPWVDEPEVVQQPAPQQKDETHNYIALESRVGQLENLILEMEDKLNGKSNALESKSN